MTPSFRLLFPVLLTICLAHGPIKALPIGPINHQTVPGSTWSFGSTPIPAGFFNPGSEPFSGTVTLLGVPGSYTPDTGVFSGSAGSWGLDPGGPSTTDTVIQRLGPANLPAPGSSDVIPIELVALNLVSAVPITVTYGGGPSEQWNVSIALTPGPQPQGSMALNLTTPNGGTFTATFPVQAHFTFVQLTPTGTTVFLNQSFQFDYRGTFTITTTDIPEPHTFWLLGLAGAFLIAARYVF